MVTESPALGPDSSEPPVGVDAIGRAIEDAIASVAAAQGRLESGQTVLLDGLDARMRAIHAAVERSRAGDALSPRLMAPLQALAQGLERLEDALKRHAPKPPPPSAPPRRVSEAYGASPFHRRGS